ncbi:MAG: AarF/ABC1/UbiB kinase family protein, partial [Candidatus Andersenbacteria bacterium]
GAEALAHGQPQAITATAKNRPQRLRHALEELGPSFIKLGQVLSTRPDLIGPAYADELRALQDQVPAFAFEQVAQVIREDFGKEPGVLFAELEREPLASASLSQVHRGRLADGTVVAVKVQRPGIVKTIEEDIALLRAAAKLVEVRSHGPHVVDAMEIVDYFDTTIHEELDFAHEAEVVERFWQLYHEHPLLVVVPRSYRELSSTRVVTLDYLDGVKITDLAGLRAAGLDPHVVAHNGLEVALSQIFEHGLFHGDPHPGNVFVLPGERIGYVDFGLTGTLSSEQKRGVLRLLLSLVDQRADLAIEALHDLHVLDADSSGDAIKPELEALFKRYLNRPLGEIEFGPLANEIFSIMRSHRLTLPRDLILLVKVLATSEAVGAQLDPDFHLIAAAQPYLQRVLRDELKPKALFKKIRDFSRVNLDVLERAPRLFSRTMGKLERGKLTVNVQHKGLDRLERAIDIGTNQVAYALVIASCIIAGAFTAGLPGRQLFGINVIAALLFGLGGALALVLIYSIWREPRRPRRH